ncbi:hypothetical protein PVAND_015610 [Polypedilum vanderplanki]|uniref:Venom protein n=1 Tax=Polypedilum vanderplanki TaxID=319348 RepID=A0A9J6BCS5_POLVA|nr:hypothetical protein PVAND_015610 [Polypedilum vanderplanki]
MNSKIILIAFITCILAYSSANLITDVIQDAANEAFYTALEADLMKNYEDEDKARVKCVMNMARSRRLADKIVNWKIFTSEGRRLSEEVSDEIASYRAICFFKSPQGILVLFGVFIIFICCLIVYCCGCRINK